jgi:hypothetical protein
MANFYGQYVGFGAGGVAAGFSYPVSTYGYMMGGNYPSAPTLLNSIERFSTESDGDAVDWADLVYGRSYPPAGQRSQDYAYCAGGSSPSQPGFVGIDKWPFASQTNATDVGDLTHGRGGSTGHSSGTYCYNAMGHGGSNTNIIDKFSVVSDGDSTDVGNIVANTTAGYSNSSATNGYSCGGNDVPGGNSNVIQRISFTSDGDSTDVADLTIARDGRASSSSVTHGYAGSGYASQDRIDKFLFATEADSTDVGNMITASYGTGGCASSLNYGYSFAGSNQDFIEKWAHASDGDATDVGNVARSRGQCAGTHG